MLQLENEVLRVAISQESGKLCSIYGKQAQLEYLWQRAFPNLFPFVGRLDGKCYTYHGTTYPMEMHGFLPHAQMTVEEQRADSCCLCFTDTPETLQSYPFHFALRIRYQLTGATIQCCFQVENRGEETLFCALGSHPGFSVPLEEGLTFEDYALTFQQPCQPELIQFSPQVLCTGERTAYPLEDGVRLPLRRELFALDAVVLANTGQAVTLSAPKGRHGVRMEYPQMPYIGFWQFPSGEPPFLCMEPWSALPGRQGVTEELTTMPNRTAVPKGETRQNAWSITVW